VDLRKCWGPYPGYHSRKSQAEFREALHEIVGSVRIRLMTDYGIGGAIYCDFTRLRERNPEGENSLGLPLAVNYVSPDALAGGVHVDTDIALGFSPALHARSTWAALA
jgi:hypothetical protein